MINAHIKKNTYRAAFGIAFAGSAALVWLSLGIGIIGRDGDPANFMYFGVIAAGLGLPWSPPAETLGLNGIFILLFCGSA